MFCDPPTFDSPTAPLPLWPQFGIACEAICAVGAGAVPQGNADFDTRQPLRQYLKSALTADRDSLGPKTLWRPHEV